MAEYTTNDILNAISPRSESRSRASIFAQPIKGAYDLVARMMQHGYSPGTQDVEGIKNVTDITAPMIIGGAGTSLASRIVGEGAGSVLGMAGGGKGGPGRGNSGFTDAQRAQIQRMGDLLQGDKNFNKNLINRFRQANPDYGGSDKGIVNHYYRTKSGEYVQPKQPTEIGGPTDVTQSQQQALDYLKNKAPSVTPQWVRQWAKESNVPIISDNHGGAGDLDYVNKTMYMKLGDPKNPVTVRFPGEDQHWGRPLSQGEVGRRFDVGTEPIGNVQGPKYDIEKYAPALMNKSLQSYSKPEILEPALQRALGAARGGGNWLIPEEYGPYQREFGSAFNPINPKKDPNQLKLFSNQNDPTTTAMLEMLHSKKGIVPGLEPAAEGGGIVYNRQPEALDLWNKPRANWNYSVQPVDELDRARSRDIDRYYLAVGDQKLRAAGHDPEKVDLAARLKAGMGTDIFSQGSLNPFFLNQLSNPSNGQQSQGY